MNTQKMIEEIRAVSEQAQRETLEREMKPCPFCGGAARIVIEGEPGHESYYALCPTCWGSGPTRDEMSEAARLWNRRAVRQ